MFEHKNQLVEKIVVPSIIAAIYVALTAISGLFGLSYYGVQFRISEALAVLPLFSPYATAGLTLGCFISNLASPLGIIDIVFGTFSTFFSAVLTRKLAFITFKGVPVLAPLPPVVVGAVVVGAMLSFLLPKGFSFYYFIIFALSVGTGQFAVCYGLGLPLFLLVKKLKIFKEYKK